MNVRRHIKHKVGSFTPIQVKVREATSNDPWGPPTALLADISDASQHPDAVNEIFQIIWKRLGDDGKNWRHVYKSLILVEYLIKTGPMSIVELCSAQAYAINTLKNFQFLDKDGKDNGVNVREKAKYISQLLKDPDLLRADRNKALQVKSAFSDRWRDRDCRSPDPYPKVAIPRSASITALSGQEANLDNKISRSIVGSPKETWEAIANSQATVLKVNGDVPTNMSREEMEECLINRAKAVSQREQGGRISGSKSDTAVKGYRTDPWGLQANNSSPLPNASSAFAGPSPVRSQVPAQNDPWANGSIAESDEFGLSRFSCPLPDSATCAATRTGTAADAFGSAAFGRSASPPATSSVSLLATSASMSSITKHQPPREQQQLMAQSVSAAPIAPHPEPLVPNNSIGASPVPFDAFSSGRNSFNGVSPTQSLAEELETKPSFLDKQGSALVNLDDVMNVKQKAVSSKAPNTLNDLRSSPSPVQGMNTQSGNISPLLPNPLIPTPNVTQTVVQPGPTWRSMTPQNVMMPVPNGMAPVGAAGVQMATPVPIYPAGVGMVQPTVVQQSMVQSSMVQQPMYGQPMQQMSMQQMPMQPMPMQQMPRQQQQHMGGLNPFR